MAGFRNLVSRCRPVVVACAGWSCRWPPIPVRARRRGAQDRRLRDRAGLSKPRRHSSAHDRCCRAQDEELLLRLARTKSVAERGVRLSRLLSRLTRDKPA